MVAPIDYDIKLCQRLLYFKNSDLWLSDTDRGWHLPILITLREVGTKNWRQRTGEGWKKRETKKEIYLAKKKYEQDTRENKRKMKRLETISKQASWTQEEMDFFCTYSPEQGTQPLAEPMPPTPPASSGTTPSLPSAYQPPQKGKGKSSKKGTSKGGKSRKGETGELYEKNITAVDVEAGSLAAHGGVQEQQQVQQAGGPQPKARATK